MDHVKRVAKLAVTSLGLTLGAVLVLGAGPAAAEPRWAVVDADGTLVRGNNVVSTQTFGSGLYEVKFSKKDITGCAFLATLGNPGSAGFPPVGFIGVVGRVGEPDAVFVVTRDIDGVGSDLSFHLKVVC